MPPTETDPTPASLLALEPRTLDAVAAEAVLGWQWRDDNILLPPEFLGKWDGGRYRRDEIVRCVELLYFSTDHSAGAVLREAVGGMGSDAIGAFVAALISVVEPLLASRHNDRLGFFSLLNASPREITVAAVLAAQAAQK